MRRRNMHYSDLSKSDLLANKVNIYLDMLDAKVVNWIGRHVDNTHIVAINNSCTTNRLLEKCRSQQHSATAWATARYSASALDRETVVCRLDDQETKLSPR
jgi:hypothetical protein